MDKLKVLEWLAMVCTLASMMLIGQDIRLMGWAFALTGSLLWVAWGLARTQCNALILLNTALIINALISIAKLG